MLKDIEFDSLTKPQPHTLSPSFSMLHTEKCNIEKLGERVSMGTRPCHTHVFHYDTSK